MNSDAPIKLSVRCNFVPELVGRVGYRVKSIPELVEQGIYLNHGQRLGVQDAGLDIWRTITFEGPANIFKTIRTARPAYEDHALHKYPGTIEDEYDDDFTRCCILEVLQDAPEEGKLIVRVVPDKTKFVGPVEESTHEIPVYIGADIKARHLENIKEQAKSYKCNCCGREM